jgi:hypothetical protein
MITPNSPLIRRRKTLSRKQPQTRNEWVDHIKASTIHDGPHSERSTITAGPNEFIKIVIIREKNRLPYIMTCNVIRSDIREDRPIGRPAHIRLSATTMLQAKEEAVDRIRILLHHALSDL